jgi:glycine hydroxymethyltransferase
MGLDLNAGGHLTHGSPVNMSGKWFKVVAYGVRRRTSGSTWTRSRPARAQQVKPKLIIAGGTAYSRIWDWKRFREIADEVGAYLMVDMAHSPGSSPAACIPRPSARPCRDHDHAQEPLRGPRGGMILTNDEEIAKKINSAVFPGLQGGPLMHM